MSATCDIYRIGTLFMSSVKVLLQSEHLCLHIFFLSHLCCLEYVFWCILKDGLEKEVSFDCQKRVDGGLQYFVSIIITG